VGTVTLLVGRANLEYADLHECGGRQAEARKLSYASWAPAAPHVGFALLESAAGVDMLHVPSRAPAQP
jgi:phage gpG-like protein